MFRFVKSILVIILFSVGVVYAAPTSLKTAQSIEYTTARNAMAAVVMGWYGSLIANKSPAIFNDIPDKWNAYRQQYPQNITQIRITSTDLTQQGEATYKFVVNSEVNYEDDAGQHTHVMREVLLFNVPFLSSPVIRDVYKESVKEIAIVEADKYTQAYYKAREFAYTWVSYLDGAKDAAADLALTQATYSTKIGSKTVTGDVPTTLAHRQKLLAKGGHSLRKLAVQPVAGSPDTYLLKLTLTWAGRSAKDKPVIAKIQQQIQYKIQDDGVWQVLSIDEQHVIPDIAPWIGLLC